MKYRELLEWLQGLPSDALDSFDVTILFGDEYYPICAVDIETESDVVDACTPILIIELGN